jgi:hypothetical protein
MFESIDYWDDNKGQDKSALKQKALKRIIKNNKIHFIKAKALSDLCGIPNKNEQFRIITEKQFNAYALILHLLEKELIEEMYLAIYRINQPTVKSIINFIESGKIKKATFVISNFFNQTKKPERWAIMLKDFCDNNANSKHIYIHNHAKVLAIKTKVGHYVFEGSGNMSDNARIEQYVYEENKEVFDFHKNWMLKLIKND